MFFCQIKIRITLWQSYNFFFYLARTYRRHLTQIVFGIMILSKCLSFMNSMCSVTEDLAGVFLPAVFSSKPETPHPAGEEWVAKCFEACDSCVFLQTGREPASPCPSKWDKIVLKISHQDRPHITTNGPAIVSWTHLSRG